jgi:hypothetical protein
LAIRTSNSAGTTSERCRTFHRICGVQTRSLISGSDLIHLESVTRGDIIDAGDLVLSQARIEMLGGDEWPALEFLWTYIVRVENGQIAHLRAWYDPDEAARAAGLSD